MSALLRLDAGRYRDRKVGGYSKRSLIPKSFAEYREARDHQFGAEVHTGGVHVGGDLMRRIKTWSEELMVMIP